MQEIIDAIKRKNVVTFLYSDKNRIVEPHTIGVNAKGNTLLRGIQYSPENDLPEWRLFDVSKIDEVETTDINFTTRFEYGYKYNDTTFTSIIESVSRVNVYYALQDIPEDVPNSIFLAGPTPRSPKVKSWRPEALSILDNMKFSGSVFVPESSDWKSKNEYDDQVEWELKALDTSRVRCFWVPRHIEDMPAFTTNVEFGMSIGEFGNLAKYHMVLGFPTDTPKMKYLNYLAEKNKVSVFNTLQDSLQKSVDLLGKKL